MKLGKKVQHGHDQRLKGQLSTIENIKRSSSRTYYEGSYKLPGSRNPKKVARSPNKGK